MKKKDIILEYYNIGDLKMFDLCPCGNKLKQDYYTFCKNCVIIIKSNFNLTMGEAKELTTRQYYKLTRRKNV